MYINTALNYTGGKFKLLPQIIPQLDYKKKTFIDIFTGGGSVFSNLLDKYDNIIINDIITELVGIHEGLYKNDLSLIEDVKKLCVEKDEQDAHNKLRESYNNDKTPAKLWALMLCSTNNMLRFNKSFKYNQTFGKRTFNKNTQLKIDILLEHYKIYPNKVSFTSKSFSDIEIDNSDYMVYIDPPYETSYISEALKKIVEYGMTQKENTIIIETDDEIRILKEIENIKIKIVDKRKYGRATIIFLEV